MLPERLSTDLTSLGDGAGPARDRRRDGGRRRRRGDGVGRLPRASCATTRSWPTTASPPGSRAAGRAARRVAARPRARRAAPPAGRASRRRLQALRHEHGALDLETIEARAGVRRRRGASTSDRDEQNRAKELIEDFMIAANGATARFLESRGFPSLRRVVRSPERWDAHRRAGRGARREAARGARRRARSQEFLAGAGPGRSGRFPDLSLSVVKLLGRGRVRGRAPGRARRRATSASRWRTTRTRPRPTAASRTSSRSGCSRRRSPATPVPYTRRRAVGAGAGTARSRRTTPRKVERQVRKSAAALLLARGSASSSTRSSPAPRQGDLGAHRAPAGRGARRARRAGSTSATASGCELVHTDVERGFIDFARA